MRCPFCQFDDTRTVDSRPKEDGSRSRRRVCPSCNQRFTTLERPRLKLPLVVKRSGRRETFDPEKLARSVAVALQNRPVREGDRERLQEELLARAYAHPGDAVTTQVLGQWALEALRAADPVACILYAAVFERVESVDGWRQLLEREAGLLAERGADAQLSLLSGAPAPAAGDS